MRNQVQIFLTPFQREREFFYSTSSSITTFLVFLKTYMHEYVYTYRYRSKSMHILYVYIMQGFILQKLHLLYNYVKHGKKKGNKIQMFVV